MTPWVALLRNTLRVSSEASVPAGLWKNKMCHYPSCCANKLYTCILQLTVSRQNIARHGTWCILQQYGRLAMHDGGYCNAMTGMTIKRPLAFWCNMFHHEHRPVTVRGLVTEWLTRAAVPCECGGSVSPRDSNHSCLTPKQIGQLFSQFVKLSASWIRLAQIL